MLGVGLIGTGFMGKCHALAWNSVRAVFGDVPAVQLVHLGETNTDLADTHAPMSSVSRKPRATGARSSTTRRSMSSPSPRPTSFIPKWRLRRLKAGKHVWCEKPMAPAFTDAEAMLAAARQSGKVAALGYNYIQSPAIRHIRKLLAEKIIGDVNHLRIEMDEDFMADPDALFYWKHEATSGYGALDDFAVHPLSLSVHAVWPRFPRHVRHVEALRRPARRRWQRPRGRNL